MAKSDEMTDEERKIAMDKATKSMTAFTNKYLENTETFLCSDSSVPAVVIKGLAEHKVNLGAPLCPCRFYDDKESEVKDGYWYVLLGKHDCSL
jgi:ferredoxin-thioredoxin reductase catalytic chain